jgi:hypothetical protein
VRARASQGEGAAADIAARKQRHATFGAIGTVAVVVLVLMVAYGTG